MAAYSRSRPDGRSSPPRSRSGPPRCRLRSPKPTTARSAWNCAKDVSRISRLPRPNCRTRFTAMLYVGRKLEQWIRPCRGEADDALGIEAPIPDDDGVTLDVDAAAAGPPGQLGVLGGSDIDVALAVELDQLRRYGRAGMLIKARVSVAKTARTTLREQLLDDLTERRQHARMVCGEAPRCPRRSPSSRGPRGPPRDALDPLLDEPLVVHHSASVTRRARWRAAVQPQPRTRPG